MKIKYDETILEAAQGQKIEELLKEQISKSEYPVVGAIYNNQYVGLKTELTNDGEIKLLDISSRQGMRIYKRTLIFIFAMVVKKLYPENEATVNYQLANATYCDLGDIEVTDEIVRKINEEMRKIVNAALPITKKTMSRKEAKEFLEKQNTLRGKLQYDIEDNDEIHLHFCEDYFNYCYGIIASNTSAVKIFDVMKYDKGLIIRYPSKNKPNQLPKLIQNKKIKWAFNEYNEIHKILDMKTVYRLNKATREGTIKDVIMLDEALHEKKIANIADRIAQNREIKMILIAGPSSSGKTTFAQRLGIQLRLNKIKPVTISVDNYFVERENNPKDENGNYNFECIEAIDLDLFNDHISKLLEGKEVEMPQFDFKVGKKIYNGNKIRLKEDEILVIEGIHCLNDKLTSKIEKSKKFKIYISALTVLNMDRYTKISGQDTRLIRRIVRDHQFRGYSAKHTIQGWPSVTRGENENIFPFQEDANVIFNTSLIYELGVLKNIAEPILQEIKQDEPEHAEAQRLLETLKYVNNISPKLVPTNSLLKEFMGGGDFKY